MTSPDVLVIGAGIVGAATAATAAAEGLSVEVLSRLDPGDGVTAAGMGHLVVLDDDPAELALSRWSLQLWRDCPLLEAAEYRPCGTLWIATRSDELAGLRAKQVRLQAAGVACEALDEPALAQAEPALRRGLAGALRVPDDGVVYAPRLARLLLDEATVRHRLRVRAGVAVQRVLPQGVQLADGRVLNAAAVVVAAGPGSAALLPPLSWVPRKGHLAITDRVPAVLHHQVVEIGYGASAHGGGDSVAFNVQPRPTGQWLIGSCRQVGRDDHALDPSMLARMLSRACSFLPGLGTLPLLRAWTGIRPGTTDGRPLIGRWPLLRGVWVATGHEGLGVTTALGSARLLVDRMLGRPSPIAGTPFEPARMLKQERAA
jgi:glycine/D-amino acid oxidase-like deaminating enzyme